MVHHWMARRLISVILVVLGVLFPLACLEALLRFGFIRQKSEELLNKLPTIDVPDPLLGFRPNPAYPSHDQRGWRNAQALSSAEIVALGDSQTYGLGANQSESWPAVVEANTGKRTYQLAFGGYGPAHYIALLDEILALNPKIVIAPLYFGNDVLDSYWLTHRPSTISPARRRTVDHAKLDELRTNDAHILDQINKAEEIDPHHVRHKYLDCQTYREIPAPGLQFVSPILQSEPLGALEQIRTPRERAHAKRKTHFEIMKVAWAAYDRIRDEFDLYKTYEQPVCIRHTWNDHRIIFSPAYRLLTLDKQDPRVTEGMRIALDSLLLLSQEMKARNIQLMVLLIPTKEFVFQNFVKGKLQSSPWLDLLWRAENEFRQNVVTFLEKNGIPMVDSLPALQKSLAAGEVPYPHSTGKSNRDADGHPNAIGYRDIAESVENGLQTSHNTKRE